MTAFVCFDRVFEILDMPHPIADKPGAIDARTPGARRVRPRLVPLPDGLGSVPRFAREGLRRRRPSGRNAAVRAQGRDLHESSPAGPSRSSDPRARGRPRSPCLSRGSSTSRGGDPRRRTRRARLTTQSLARAVGVVTQDPHLFHDTIAHNLRYARPEPPTTTSSTRMQSRADLGLSRRFPTASTRWSASAATVCPVARSSASRSRECSSRIPRSSSSTKRPPPRLRIRGSDPGRARGRARTPHRHRDRAPPLDDRRRGRDLRRGRRKDRGTRSTLRARERRRTLRGALRDPVQPRGDRSRLGGGRTAGFPPFGGRRRRRMGQLLLRFGGGATPRFQMSPGSASGGVNRAVRTLTRRSAATIAPT